ncbi:hypothetical protein M514_07834 [Trichuris suis]|uniref:Uncharacterized protein n=1 Tax=Trichuris suis TaxID=68888 RepID=A0A085N5D3_9BILA|nr:hypothetical protein M514_07834 [Trichuris suis]
MHRDLKACLQGNPTWGDALPILLMGMRAAFKPDVGASTAELVFSEPLRLPGHFFAMAVKIPKVEIPIGQNPDSRNPEKSKSRTGQNPERSKSRMGQNPERSKSRIGRKGAEEPHTTFAQDLHQTFVRLRPKDTAWHPLASGRPVFMPPSLQSATHVFVRVDSYSPRLQPPYKGPYRVVKRGPKSYLLELDGGVYSVPIDRLKPAFLLAPLPETSHQPSDDQPVLPTSDAQRPSFSPAATRSGRVPRPLARYSD